MKINKEQFIQTLLLTSILLIFGLGLVGYTFTLMKLLGGYIGGVIALFTATILIAIISSIEEEEGG